MSSPSTLLRAIQVWKDNLQRADEAEEARGRYAQWLRMSATETLVQSLRDYEESLLRSQTGQAVMEKSLNEQSSQPPVSVGHLDSDVAVIAGRTVSESTAMENRTQNGSKEARTSTPP